MNDRLGLRELAPLCPEAPRLCPARERPAYRFVPGLHPHPIEDPRGHSYGKPETAGVLLPPGRWHECESYLFGIDLYNEGYLWEAHEAWEGLWKQAERSDPQAQFLQGLIQNSAAQLKVHIASTRGAASLSRSACAHLEAAAKAAQSLQYMGVDIAGLLETMRAHYAPLWQPDLNSFPLLPSSPPCLRVVNPKSRT